MVVIFLPPTVDIWVWQDLTALPSIWTVQAPHRPEPQPYLVPMSLRCSRTTQSRAVSGSASTLTALPLIVNATPSWVSSLANGSPDVRYFPAEPPNAICFWIGRKACTRGAAAWRGFCSDRGRLCQTGDARSRTFYDALAFARNVRKDR